MMISVLDLSSAVRPGVDRSCAPPESRASQTAQYSHRLAALLERWLFSAAGRYTQDMDETHLRGCLARAERNVESAKERVSRERERITELERAGHDTGYAVTMLRVLEHSRDAYEKHREEVLELLEMTQGRR